MKKLFKVLGVVTTICYVFYLYVGYLSIRATPTVLLIDYSLFPKDVPAQWMGVPFKSKIVRDALYSKMSDQVQQDFRGYGYTLYFGALGYRGADEPKVVVRTPSELIMLRNIANFVYRSGVALDWVDSSGCTAIHQAILYSDEASVEYFLSLGSSLKRSNPTARYKPCRLDIAVLAEQEGLTIKGLSLDNGK